MFEKLFTIACLTFGIAMVSPALAAKDIAPKVPPVVPLVGQVIDHSRPQYAPGFLQPAGASLLQQERDWSITNNIPPTILWGTLGVRSAYFGPTFGHRYYR